jgi:hypothetical protein
MQELLIWFEGWTTRNPRRGVSKIFTQPFSERNPTICGYKVCLFSDTLQPRLSLESKTVFGILWL